MRILYKTKTTSFFSWHIKQPIDTTAIEKTARIYKVPSEGYIGVVGSPSTPFTVPLCTPVLGSHQESGYEELSVGELLS